MSFVENKLAEILSRNWWMLLLRGLVAIAFGILIFMQPSMSLAALIMLFGVLLVILAFKARSFGKLLARF